MHQKHGMFVTITNTDVPITVGVVYRPPSLLGKPSLANKTLKNIGVFMVSGGRTNDLSLLKGFLHNCGRAGISFKQVKKIRQNRQMYSTFPESQKNTCTNFAFETH